MAANEYYHDSSNPYYSQNIRPGRQSPPSAHQPYSANHSFNSSTLDHTFGSNPQPAPKPDSHFCNSADSSNPSNDRFSDSIPLKNTSKINTSQQNWPNQNTQYPPSPESQTEAQLLPRPKAKKTGFFSGRIPWVVYFLTMVQITVFIVEIIKNSIITGSPIAIHPQFNPMIGPSVNIYINMGARFVPCMRITEGVQDSAIDITWSCPNSTTSATTHPDDPSNRCGLKELCGLGGLNPDNPNQWYRFITPMFLHAGLIHITFNMLLQLTTGKEMEQAIGSIRFALVYFSSGIFGFVLGGNFAAPLIASTGASGCLFGVIALVLLDLVYHWNERPHPVRELMWILGEIVISLVLGLLPGLDNFSHIGGFLMGLVAGICILHSPTVLQQRIGEPTAPYRNFGSESDMLNPKSNMTAPATATPADVTAFAKQPVGFFKDRKSLWWAWWLLRAGALIGVLIGFVVLINNFYKYHDTCSWCKYLSCLPINNWCEIGNLNLQNSTLNTTSNKRELARGGSTFVTELFERATF